MHLLMDGYSADKALLQNEQFLKDLLADYPAKVGMTRISEPYVIRYDDCPPEEWGISGFVFLAESHIAIHTFVEKLLVNVDLFSCKDFDTETAAEDLKQRFKLTKSRVSCVERDWERSRPEDNNPPRFQYHGA
ncbi:MAG: S-adenosylmethionine decarboxylase [Chloroflexota bacterium]